MKPLTSGRVVPGGLNHPLQSLLVLGLAQTSAACDISAQFPKLTPPLPAACLASSPDPQGNIWHRGVRLHELSAPDVGCTSSQYQPYLSGRLSFSQWDCEGQSLRKWHPHYPRWAGLGHTGHTQGRNYHLPQVDSRRMTTVTTRGLKVAAHLISWGCHALTLKQHILSRIHLWSDMAMHLMQPKPRFNINLLYSLPLGCLCSTDPEQNDSLQSSFNKCNVVHNLCLFVTIVPPQTLYHHNVTWKLIACKIAISHSEKRKKKKILLHLFIRCNFKGSLCFHSEHFLFALVGWANFSLLKKCIWSGSSLFGCIIKENPQRKSWNSKCYVIGFLFTFLVLILSFCKAFKAPLVCSRSPSQTWECNWLRLCPSACRRVLETTRPYS